MNSEQAKNFINFDHKSFSKMLYELSPLEFTALGCLIGLMISPTLTIDEQNSLGNFLELVGQVILTVNAQATTITPSNNNQGVENLRQEFNQKFNYLLNEIRKKT